MTVLPRFMLPLLSPTMISAARTTCSMTLSEVSDAASAAGMLPVSITAARSREMSFFMESFHLFIGIVGRAALWKE